MTIEKMTCGDCSVVFEFEPNSRFPRKYCEKCGLARKATWEASNKQTQPTPENPSPKAPEQAPKDKYELTIGSVRYNALASAITYLKGDKFESINVVLNVAETFESYILNGVKA